MLRYIKIKSRWIDTLSELKNGHVIYMVINNKVHCLYENDEEQIIGELEDESDEQQDA